MHIAESRAKAAENVRFGLADWTRYYTEVIALPFELRGTLAERCEKYIASDHAVIGDPDDAVAKIEKLLKQSGGFGCFLQLAHNWADFAETKRSYELIARYVMPRFSGANEGREASLTWAAARRDELMGASKQAKQEATRKHQEERARSSRSTSTAP